MFGVVFAVFVALQFKRVRPGGGDQAVVRADEKATVEATAGSTLRFSGSREDVRVAYQQLFNYPDGSSKFVGVTIDATDRNKATRTFTITAKEGRAGKDESHFALDGNVRLESSDGMTIRTEHAVYHGNDGSIDVDGPVTFTRGRFSGSGVGLRYDKGRDVLNIVTQPIVHIAADAKGEGRAEVTSGSMAFARRDKVLHFDGAAHVDRGTQTIDADTIVARLNDDESHVQAMELHNHARIAATNAAAGALQGLTGADMTLTYAGDGQTLQRAVIFNEAVITVAGEAGKAGRRIAAKTIDVTLGPDGTTPVLLIGREGVELALPADGDTPARTIRALALDGKGEPGRGLTRATFTGNVQFRERERDTERAVNSTNLDVVMKPGMSTIEEARFAHQVRFEQPSMAAQAAAARYDLAKGTLELTGSEPGYLIPHMENDQIAVDGTRIDVTLEGPIVNAKGNIKSTIQPRKKDAKSNAKDTRLPAMLKQDQPVSVLADSLAYDGSTSIGTYTGSARLFQGDTTIKGDVIAMDEKKGDLTATGNALTTTAREQVNKDKKKERVLSTARAKDMKYEDSVRRLTYTGNAHVVGPEGDMAASKIELYLSESGDDVERAEGYTDGDDKMTLKEQNRTTTGKRLSYTAEKETYKVTGLPATVVDECGRETIGSTLTFVKATDTIVVDGNQQIRTQSKGGTGKCQ